MASSRSADASGTSGSGSAGSGLSKYGAPDIGSNVDAGRSFKLAQRVERTLKSCVNPQPKQIDPRQLLVAPANRDGAPPNVKYIHEGILGSLKKLGFDRTRPQVGICIQCKSPEAKRKLLEWNRTFSEGQSLLPPIDPEKAMYGTLAGTHLNIALRIIQANTPSPSLGCDPASLAPPGSSLAELVENGHHWWILPEETAREAQVEVSVWRNMDQNENQSVHEIEILRNIVQTCAEMSVTRSTMPLGDIISFALRRMPAKISGPCLQHLAKFYLKLVEEKHQHLAAELQDFHSAKVNPRDLVVAPAFFGSLATESGFSGAPLVRHYLLLANYTNEKVKHLAGQPDQGTFIENSVLVNFSKKPDLVKMLERLLSSGREKYLPVLEKAMTPLMAKNLFADLANMWIRSLLGKPAKAEWNLKSLGAAGKFDDARAKDLATHWARGVDEKHQDLGFLYAVGLQDKEDGAEDDEIVNLEHLQGEQDHRGADLKTFKPGDLVTVCRRMTWTIELPDRKDYRKDLDKGLSGTVVGYADEHHRQILVEFELRLPNARGGFTKKVTDKCFPRNLMLSEEYETLKAQEELGKESAAAASRAKGAEEESSTPGSLKKKLPKKYSFLWDGLEDEPAPEDIVVEPRWDKLLDTDSALQRLWVLRGKAALMTHAVMQSLPTVGPEDLLVVNRAAGKGVYKSEVWTLRPFGARELVLPFLSTELKDCYWTRGLNAMIGLAPQGPSAHPEGKQFALDGRNKNLLARAGSIDEQEHRGHLCWAIQRSDDPDVWNLTVEHATGDVSVNLHLPWAKKRKVVTEYPQDHLPSIPVIVNRKPLAENTRLVLQAPQAPKEAGSSKKTT